MRASLGLLVTTLALGCFEEDTPPATTTPGTEATTAGTTGPGSTGGTETDPTTVGTGPTGDGPTTGVTTDATDTLDTGSTGLVPGECEDGEVTPGELCLGDLTVLMANDTIVAARIGDVSGSAAADVVYLLPNQLVVRVGDGSGNFGAAVFDEAIDGVTFELRDFNGDGELDVVAIEQNGPLRVLLGNGGGAFTPSDLDPVGADPRALAVGSLDAGPSLDVVVGNGMDGMVLTALGVGDGDLMTPTSYVAFGSVHGVALADFTGDGDLDVALTIQGGGIEGLALRPGDGSGGLLDQRVTPGAMTGAEGVAAGDFNEDGHADVAYVSHGLDAVGVLLGSGDGTFQPEQIYPVGPGPTVLVADDLTGDGREDLLLAHDGEASVRILVPDSRGAMVEAPPLAVAAVVTDLDTGDVNGDGVLDVAATSGPQHIVTVLLSTP